MSFQTSVCLFMCAGTVAFAVQVGINILVQRQVRHIISILKQIACKVEPEECVGAGCRSPYEP